MAQPIYVLGLGNIGKLIAHSLAASRAPPPITLLFHRSELADQWRDVGGGIDVTTKGITHRQSNFTVAPVGQKKESGDAITNLIVSTKTYATAEALRPLKHRLGTQSSILFLQNGMGRIFLQARLSLTSANYNTERQARLKKSPSPCLLALPSVQNLLPES